MIIVVFSVLSPNYFTRRQLPDMSNHVAIFGLLSIGMLLVILNGGIDLSVGSVLALCGVVAGALMQGVTLEWRWASSSIRRSGRWSSSPARFGALVGAVNGVLIACFKVPAFVATLGTLYVARGVALLMTNGLTYNNLGGRAELGNTGFDWLGFNRIGGVPIGVIVLAVVAVICHLALTRTAFGRWLYASGGNERAAELSGVPTKRVKISVYVLSGVCAAIAGLVLSSQLTSAGPTAGTTYELTAIAAVVIGGAALTGGPRHRRRHDARRLRHRLPVGRPRHHRRLVLLADRLHRRRHRPRRAAQLASSTGTASGPDGQPARGRNVGPGTIAT